MCSLANYSFEAASPTAVLKQEHFGLAVIQVKGKTDDENNESTGKAIKGEEAITVATSDSLHIQLNCLLWEQLIMSTATWLCTGKLLAGNKLPHSGTTLNAPSLFLRFHTSSKSNVKAMYYYICNL